MPALPSSLISSLSQAPPVTVPETAAGLPAALACLPDAAIGILRVAGLTNIAAANRHHARDSTRPLALLGIT